MLTVHKAVIVKAGVWVQDNVKTIPRIETTERSREFEDKMVVAAFLSSLDDVADDEPLPLLFEPLDTCFLPEMSENGQSNNGVKAWMTHIPQT